MDRMEIDGTLVIGGVSWLGSAGVGSHWGGGRDNIVNQQVEGCVLIDAARHVGPDTDGIVV